MTYGRFLFAFVVLPLLWVGFRHRHALRVGGPWPTVVLFCIVYAATSPWDNLAVKEGIWDFDDARTWGVRWLYLPVEEYLFFGLQTALVGAWVKGRLQRSMEGWATP
jgi:lycopene cyclase domain-containing protein